ncbi:MAG: Biotin synthase [Chlamydiae bacterium]|nr:Biotin synthase [Chlamydiota bacterium]
MIRHDWEKDELLSLYKMPILELIFKSATVHRQFNNPSELQMCHLISIKTGGCSEDCKYCSQSSRYTTSVKAQPFMKIEEVIKRAESAKSKGATRVCLGSAWRQIRDSKQFDEILKIVKTIDKMGLEVCCTLGMLNEDQAKKLKDAGLYAYNHNLDTSDKYYKQIITSRSYEDRLKTLSAVREANISVCCGGIIGLGEKVEDRVRLIQTLSSFNPHPESVPINRLIPIKGTPFGEKKQVSIWDLIRTIAVAKISMPRSMIRLSAGREKMTSAEQSLCFLAGANSIFIGEKLLTAPNKNLDQDEELFKTLDLQPRRSFKVPS